MIKQKENRWCCRVYPIVLVLISAIIAVGIWYFNKDVHSLVFLKNWTELINFVGTVLFVAILPIGIFYYLNEKEKFQDKAKLWALSGFIPALLYLVFIIA